MSRKLSDEDRALWDRLSQSVRPLRRGPAASDAASSELAIEAQKKPMPGRPQAPVSPPPAKPQPALAPLEERTRRRLARGLAEVDARIDLHGMRQERAFNALVAFLRKAQARGDRFVLVVTGKGRASEDGRGILRESVPAWLARPDLRNLIVGWEQASRRHGGAGALYVRVRRRREGRSS
jgi:DNA-nicking Smr family endonuclease